MNNFNYTATSDDLAEFFSQNWEVKSISIPTDRETGRTRGIAFVNLATDSQEDDAIETANGTEFMGRPLRLDRAKSRP